MKRSGFIKLISCILTLVLLFTASGATLVAAAEETSGKYVKDVFIAYGEKKEDAEKWLRDHGWEPFTDLNDGKNSKAKTNAVAVMGYKRTDNPEEAITDMATMYMRGGYSFDDYEDLVKKKRVEIDEFINSFVPALEEYRLNYQGKGSKGGKKRAQMVRALLNKFYDGDPNDPDAVNDTGKPLGDLLLKKTKTELGEEAYAALSAEDKAKTADLQQIILESSGPAVLIVEQALALATDTSTKSWLQRLDGLTGADLVDNIEKYAPEAEGQDLAPSAALSLLAAHFEDSSKKLAEQWIDVHEDILWYENYCEENGLRQAENSDDNAKVEQFFNDMRETDEERYTKEFDRFTNVDIYYSTLKKTAYSGDWGDTLFDFFRPEDDNADYSDEIDYFAPLAASLSKGQRAALEFISLTALLKMGMDSSSVTKADLPSVKEMFKDKDGNVLESISIYSGINRAIFRKGVALTSDALMQKNLGRDPYDEIWDLGGMVDMAFYVGMGAGFISMVTGAVMAIHASRTLPSLIKWANRSFVLMKESIESSIPGFIINDYYFPNILHNSKIDYVKLVTNNTNKYIDAQKAVNSMKRVGTAGRWLMGIGGALMILAAILKGVQMAKYYNRTFSVIPRMIVEERKIVTTTTDENGNEVDLINFDQFDYYEVAKCNRQEIGIHTSAQNGVSDYQEWGCGDAADLNADVGKQWLALYVNRAGKKGQPILADTLKLRTGKEEVKNGNKASEAAKKPDGYDGCLHMFNSTGPVLLDNEDFCFRSDNEGMYVFWKTDANAYPAEATASAFSGGVLALAGFGGIGLGILGTTIVMFPKMKKKKEEEAA